MPYTDTRAWATLQQSMWALPTRVKLHLSCTVVYCHTYVATSSHCSISGYDTSLGYGTSSGYGISSGYSTSSRYGISSDYSTSSGYGISSGYSTSSGYGTYIITW